MAAFSARGSYPDPRRLGGELVEIDGSRYRVSSLRSTELGIGEDEAYPAHLPFDLLVSGR